jgi:zinc protease
MRVSLRIFRILLIFLLSNPLFGQQPAKNVEIPRTAEEVRYINRSAEIVARLENGMVAIVKEYKNAPVAAVRLYVKAGSIYNQEHLGAGLSHLTEHLLLRGTTKTRSEADSLNLLQQIGARYDSYSTKDHTCYHLTVPALQVGVALDLLADWVTGLSLTEDAFKREWGVVQRELEMYSENPKRQLDSLFDELRYKVHPARFPVLGHQAIVKSLTLQIILDYYQRMYVPDNTVLVIVGDINVEGMLQAIKKEFADFTRRSTVNVVLPREPEVAGPRELLKVLPSMKGPAKINLGFPSIDLLHDDLYALDTLAGILGTGKSSRLYRALREETQLVLDITADNDAPPWAAGTFTIHCELPPENIAKARKAIWEEIELLKKEPVTATELNRVKKQIQVNRIRANQTAAQQADSLGRDYISTGDLHFSDRYVQNIQQVAAEQIQQMAQKYLLREKQLTLLLTAQPLAPSAADAQKKAPVTPIKKIILDNGLRILLKHDSSVPLVNMQLYILGGLIQETDENNGITNLMAKLSVKGTRTLNASQIIAFFENRGAALSAGAGNDTFYYKAEVLPEDFPRALEIFSEIVLEPNFPQEELDKLKPEVVASIEQVDNSWSAQARRFFLSKFYTKNPYRRDFLGTPQTVLAITRPQIQEFHKTTVAGSRAVLAVFGNIDLAVAENLIRQRFASMSTSAPLALDKIALDTPPKTARQFIQEISRTGAAVYVGFPGIKFTDIQDRYSLEVLEKIVGSSTSPDWLFGKLRAAQLVYSAGGFNIPGILPGYFAAYAQCEPDKAPQSLQNMQQLLDKAAKGIFTEEEINRAKRSLVNAAVIARQTNAQNAAVTALDELYGLGFDWSKGYADRIMAIGLQEVQAVAKKILAAPATVTIITSQPDKFPKTPAK